jgi:hypothetical protein
MAAAGSPSGSPPPRDDDVPGGATPLAVAELKRALPNWSPSSSEVSSWVSPDHLAGYEPGLEEWYPSLEYPAPASWDARPVAADSPAQVLVSPMMPRILDEEFEQAAVASEQAAVASEEAPPPPSPQLPDEDDRAYKRRLRALAEEQKRAKKAAEAAEAAEAVMPSAAAVAQEVSDVLARLIWELEFEEGYAVIASW